MWRLVAGTIALAVLGLGADLPQPVRIPAAPPTLVEAARRDALAEYGAARLRQRADDSVGAVRKLEVAAKLDPAALAPRRELVSVYADLGRDAAAIRTARSVLKDDPTDPDTAHHLAKLLFEVQRYGEASEALAAAIDSPRLADRPIKELAMRTDLAVCRDRAADSQSARSWQTLREKLFANRERLLKAGLTRGDLDAEAATAAEKHGRALMVAKQYDAAQVAFVAARDLYADPKRANDPAGAARLHRNLADLAAARGETDAAVRHLGSYLEFRPRDAAPYEQYAALIRKTGENPVPRLEALPGSIPKWVALAERGRKPAEFADVHARLTELALETSDPVFFRILLQCYSTADSGSGILQIAESIFPNPPDRPRKGNTVPLRDSERRQAFATALVAHPALAVKMARATRFTTRTTRSPEFWELLAWACGRSGPTDVVEEALRSAFESDGNFRTFQRLAQHLIARRQWQDVLALCNRSSAVGQGIVNFYRCVPLAELGQAQAALRAVENAEGDNAFLSRRQKIHIFDILGRHADMLKECDAAMVEFRTPAETRSLRFLRAQALLGLKNYRESEIELRGILDDDADDALALNNLGYNLADQNRNLDEAERLIRRAIEIDTDDRIRAGAPNVDHAAYLDSLGWVLFRKGKFDEARELLEKAATLPDGSIDPTVWDHLGDVAFRQGDRKRAKEAWAKAVKFFESTHSGREGGRRDEAIRKSKLAD